jgi:predicted sulfurtransferase
MRPNPRFVGALCPQIRQFSDFPRWCDQHRAELAGKKVLMYCTGGIRCERASAYVAAAAGAAEAVQLGINPIVTLEKQLQN